MACETWGVNGHHIGPRRCPLRVRNGHSEGKQVCPPSDIRWCAGAAFFLSVTWSLYYIEPVWQFVGRAVRWCMSRKDVTAALDRRDETGGDLIVVHTRGQGINRRLPLRMMNFLCDP